MCFYELCINQRACAQVKEMIRELSTGNRNFRNSAVVFSILKPTGLWQFPAPAYISYVATTHYVMIVYAAETSIIVFLRFATILDVFAIRYPNLWRSIPRMAKVIVAVSYVRAYGAYNLQGSLGRTFDIFARDELTAFNVKKCPDEHRDWETHRFNRWSIKIWQNLFWFSGQPDVSASGLTAMFTFCFFYFSRTTHKRKFSG